MLHYIQKILGILIIVLAVSILNGCLSEEEKIAKDKKQIEEYEKTEAYQKAQQMIKESQQSILDAQRRLFEIQTLRPLEDSLRKLKNKLRVEEALGYSKDKYFPLRQKIIDVEIAIANAENDFLANKLSNAWLQDSISK
jgi:hypothetical protein